ncbi:uncharacterized protein M8220_007608 isoform 1-T1 [Acridotheres tristis]
METKGGILMDPPPLELPKEFLQLLQKERWDEREQLDGKTSEVQGFLLGSLPEKFSSSLFFQTGYISECLNDRLMEYSGLEGTLEDHQPNSWTPQQAHRIPESIVQTLLGLGTTWLGFV